MNKRNHKLETEVIHAGYEAGGLYLLGRPTEDGLARWRRYTPVAEHDS
ncbi:hypothetical protein [Virgibacillus sp. Bac330]|nr:hypothetical protein [Virgibacillus sp. Bac330]